MAPTSLSTARELLNSTTEKEQITQNTFLTGQDNEIEGFDLDMYFILVRFLFDPEKRSLNQLFVVPLHRANDT